MNRPENKISKAVLKEKLLRDTTPRITLSFYTYSHIGNPSLFRDYLYIHLSNMEVFGRIYVAHEGVNGQLSVPEKNLGVLRQLFDTITFFKGIRLNRAISDNGKSFYKLISKVRPKIVADGLNGLPIDMEKRGIHLKAAEFNNLAKQDDVIIVDMRNHYESEVGRIKGAITPPASTFREELPMVANMLKNDKDKPVIMYCTGGIRCEKASAYLRHIGFNNVFQLDGGIIEYARQVKENGLKNLFIGKNFVFDERLGERITPDIIAHCHQCGAPCDDHANCANDTCHRLFIQCNECRECYKGCCCEDCSKGKG